MTEQSISILLAEDNMGDAMLTSRAIQRSTLNASVQLVRDGAEALDYIFTTGDYSHRDKLDVPKLIILDIKMPRLTGLEVLEQIRTNPSTQAIPVIMFSSSSQEKDIQESYMLGANEYIVKPIDAQEYTSVIQQSVEKWSKLAS